MKKALLMAALATFLFAGLALAAPRTGVPAPDPKAVTLEKAQDGVMMLAQDDTKPSTDKPAKKKGKKSKKSKEKKEPKS